MSGRTPRASRERGRKRMKANPSSPGKTQGLAFLVLSSAVVVNAGCGRAPESPRGEVVVAQGQAVLGADAGACGAGAPGLVSSPLALKVLTNSCGANQAQNF